METLVGAVLGIGAFGTKEDAKLVLKLWTEVSIKVRSAVIQAVSTLDPVGHLPMLTEALLGDNCRASCVALEALISHIDSLDQDQLCSHLVSDPREHVRRNVLRLLTHLSYFDQLRFALVAVNDSSVRIQTAANGKIAQWINRYNRVFVTPTKQQIKDIDAALSRCSNQLDAVTLEWIHASLNPFRKS
jgi:hypothetical protein